MKYVLALLMVLWCEPTFAAVLSVPAGGNLQAAIDKAQPGDAIELEPNARFLGEFVFPCKAGNVTLTTAGSLPARRIGPADAPLLATIASPYGSMAVNLYGSCNWTLTGLRFEANVGGAGEVIGMWNADHITLDRLLLDVPDPQEQKRFILGNGTNIILSRSYCSGVWKAGQDSQCFVAWDGTGPYTITDNFLEAASENVMFGGADSSSPASVPSDITVEGNNFSKRLIWKGQARGVKNLFELKAARRVTVRNNTFERNWVDAQAGRAILFTPRNQSGTAPWTVVEDVLFENNTVKDVAVGISITGVDDASPSGQTSRIVVRNNAIATTSGQAFLLMDEIGALEISGNTISVPSGAAMMTLAAGETFIKPNWEPARLSTYAVNTFTFVNNTYNGYIHSATALNAAALAAYCLTVTTALPAPQPAPQPTPTPTPTPDPVVVTDRQRVDAAIAELEPLLTKLTGKALTNLKNILTRLKTLQGQVQ